MGGQFCALYERRQGMLERHALPLIASTTDRCGGHKVEGRTAHRILISIVWRDDLGNCSHHHRIIIGGRAGTLVVGDRLRGIEDTLWHEETRGRLGFLWGMWQGLSAPIRGMDGDVPKGLRHILGWRVGRGRVLWRVVH